MADGAAAGSVPDVAVVAADGRRERALLAALFDRYVEDLSAHTDHYVLDGEGRWQPDGLAPWWDDAGRHRYLVVVDGRAAGFALVGAPPFPWVSPDRDWCLADFFVSRAVRRRGVGRAAVAAVLARHPGAWEVPTDPANEAAVAFWRRALAALDLPGLHEVRTARELVQRFDVPPGWVP